MKRYDPPYPKAHDKIDESNLRDEKFLMSDNQEVIVCPYCNGSGRYFMDAGPRFRKLSGGIEKCRYCCGFGMVVKTTNVFIQALNSPIATKIIKPKPI